MASSNYELLFSPANIGKLKLKNRIVKTAAQTYLFDSGENRMGPRATAFYSAVARGGAGLIITETPAMEWPLLEEGDRRFRVDNDKYLKQLEAFAKEIHKYETPLFSQFYHRGPWSGIYALAAQPCAATAVTHPSPFDVHDANPPHALSIEEIEMFVDRFASGAARIQAAGWDGVEVNAGGAFTVSTVPLVTPASAAEMVVVPAEIPVANPPAVTEATPVLDEAQVACALRFCVLPSE